MEDDLCHCFHGPYNCYWEGCESGLLCQVRFGIYLLLHQHLCGIAGYDRHCMCGHHGARIGSDLKCVKFSRFFLKPSLVGFTKIHCYG